MTALTKYQRLEARGLWRDLPDAQRREVVVNLGQASLTLTDPRSDTAITHWSLPAILRLNPGIMPALYAPAEDSGETLEVDDRDMVAALETVHAAIRAARPRPGRLRGAMRLGLLAAVVAAGAVVLPGAVVRHTAAILPPVTRAEIGALALADLARVTGAPCAAGRGPAILDELGRRLFPGQPPVTLLIVREGLRDPVALPGRRVVLPLSLIAEAEGPALLAGAAIALRTAADAADPVLPVLDHAGPVATFRLMTRGTLEAAAVQGYAARLLAAPLPEAPAERLIERFAAAGVPTGPWAWFRDPTGERVLALIEADPFPRGAPPLMPPDDWAALQDICGG